MSVLGQRTARRGRWRSLATVNTSFHVRQEVSAESGRARLKLVATVTEPDCTFVCFAQVTTAFRTHKNIEPYSVKVNGRVGYAYG